MDDLQIINLIRSGNNNLALNALYRDFPMIRKLIRSKGGTRKDAEDIFQEALIVLLRKAAQPEFLLTAKLSTYLYSVCRHLWSDHLKRQKNHVQFDEIIGSPGLAAVLTPAESSALDDAIRHETRIRLAERVVSELKDRCRELLLLFYVQHLSLATIAAKMGYGSENSAKNQKYKCLEAARNRLKELEKQSQTI